MQFYYQTVEQVEGNLPRDSDSSVKAFCTVLHMI